MHETDGLEAEIATLIVEVLFLEDIAPAEIDPAGPLFEEGLGLDSIDALEIAVALESRYGVAMGEDAELNRERFASIRNLARFVTENRKA